MLNGKPRELLTMGRNSKVPLEAFEALFLGKRDKDSWDPRPSLPDEVFVKEEVLELARGCFFLCISIIWLLTLPIEKFTY